ncbi:MAG: SBBP repeat-containing protein [Deltaproteobacteria bacterium]|nr:SBBP repeat-containing protein [Deltaproteobacteria bacterium]
MRYLSTLFFVLVFAASCGRYGFEEPSKCEKFECGEHGVCQINDRDEPECVCFPGWGLDTNGQCTREQIHCESALDCNDDNPCTMDYCDPVAGCSWLTEAAWLTQFGSPENDLVNDLAVDSATGDIYVVGTAQGDFDTQTAHADNDDGFLAKYDATGNRQWIRYLSSASSADEAFFGVAVDAHGTVYVTGYGNTDLDGDSLAPVTPPDVLAAKYDSDGNQIWMTMWGESGRKEYGMEIFAFNDGLTDRVVTFLKTTDESNTNQRPRFNDLLPSTGAHSLLWWIDDAIGEYRPAHASLGTKAFYACAWVQGAQAGAVTSEGADGGGWFINKVAFDGSQLWVTHAGSPGNEYPYHVTEGLDGVYITGEVRGVGYGTPEGTTFGGPSDLFLVKLDFNGNRLWARQEGDGPSASGYTVAQRPTGEVLVSGDLNDQRTICAYTTDGTLQSTELALRPTSSVGTWIFDGSFEYLSGGVHEDLDGAGPNPFHGVRDGYILRRCLQEGPAIAITGINDFTVSTLVDDTTTKDASGNYSQRALGISWQNGILYTCMMRGTPLLLAYDLHTGQLLYSAPYDRAINNNWCKSASVHSSGRVYYGMGDSDRILLTQNDLSDLQYVTIDDAVGVPDTGDSDFDPEWVEVDGDLLYIASDELGRIYRFLLDPTTGDLLGLDPTWGTGGSFIQLTDESFVPLDASANLAGMFVDPDDGSLWAVAENAGLVYKIAPTGDSFVTGVVDLGGGLRNPQDIAVFGDYLLISYAANDGDHLAPEHGVGVFDRTTYQKITVLIDGNTDLRNALGIVANSISGIFYVVDGSYGAPNDLTLPMAYDENEADKILKFSYIW